MSEIPMQLSLMGAETDLVPGTMIEVEAAFHPMEETAVDSAWVELLWYTSGKGDRDSAVGSSRSLLDPGMTLTPGLRRRAVLAVPLMPWTYHGEDLKIDWVLRLCVKPKRGRIINLDRDVVIHPTAAGTT